MVEIKAYDRWTNKEYVEDNYEYLYATLRGLGDITVERIDEYVYEKGAMKRELLKYVMLMCL